MNGIHKSDLSRSSTVSTWLSEVTDWLPLTLLIGAGPGLALAIVRHGNAGFAYAPKGRPDTLVSLYNASARQWTFLALLISVALWLSGCVVVAAMRHRATDRPSYRNVFVEQNCRFLPVATLPLVAYLFCNRTVPRIDQVDLTLIALLTATIAYWCFRSASAGRLSWVSYLRPKSAVSATVMLLVLWIVYSLGASYTSIVEHWGMGTRVFDLGVYDNTVYNTSHGRWLECAFTRHGTHLSAHVDPILILISPLYWIYPHAETLLVLQSFWLGSAAIPLYLYARRKGLGYGEALIIAASYYLIPALHGVNFFDFHSLALMVPLVVFVIYWLEEERWWLYALGTGLLLLVREDQAIIVATIGLYALVTRRVKAGAWTLVGAVAYAILAQFVVSKVLGPEGGRTYEYYYGEVMATGKKGAFGLLYSALSNPMLALATLLKLSKIYYFLKLFLPLCFFPLLAGRKLWLLAYGVAFIGLSSRSAVPTVHYQYSALILPFLMVAGIDGLERLFAAKVLARLEAPKQPLRLACFGAILVASLATSVCFGAWPSNPDFHSGQNRLYRRYGDVEAARQESLKRVRQQIPEAAMLCVDETLGPHVGSREKVTALRKCRRAEYVLVYKKKLSKAERRALSRLKPHLSTMYSDEHFVLYQAKGDSSVESDPVIEPEAAEEAEAQP